MTKKVHCPMCGKPHIRDFAELVQAYRLVLRGIDLPDAKNEAAAACVGEIIRDATAGFTIAQALYKHVALAEFYFAVLDTDTDDLELAEAEHDTISNLVEELWHKAMDLTKEIQRVRVDKLDEAMTAEGKTLEQVFKEEAIGSEPEPVTWDQRRETKGGEA